MRYPEFPYPRMKCLYRLHGQREWTEATILDTGGARVYDEDDNLDYISGPRLIHADGTEINLTGKRYEWRADPAQPYH